MRDDQYAGLPAGARAALTRDAIAAADARSAEVTRVDSPRDRLEACYAIGDLARQVREMAAQLEIAESLFESDLGDEQVFELVRVMRGIRNTMEGDW